MARLFSDVRYAARGVFKNPRFSMVAVAAVLITAWWTAAVGWTWYALIGASVSGFSALAISVVLPAGAGVLARPRELPARVAWAC